MDSGVIIDGGFLKMLHSFELKVMVTYNFLEPDDTALWNLFLKNNAPFLQINETE